MTNVSLARSYLVKAKVRLKILKPLHEAQGYSDVMREAQEIVELCLKGMLRFVGVEPPKWHDVGNMIIEFRSKFSSLDQKTTERLASISSRLRKEREISFYGDVDFIPTEEYEARDSEEAMQDAQFTVSIAETVIH